MRSRQLASFAAVADRVSGLRSRCRSRPRRRSPPSATPPRPICRSASRSRQERNPPTQGRCRQEKGRAVLAGDPRIRSTRMSLAERVGVQFDLAWTGDYNGLINGEFNDRYGSRGQSVSGPQRHGRVRRARAGRPCAARCRHRRRSRRRSAGPWSTTAPPARRSACRPSRCRIRPPARSGTRWSSAQGQVQVETFRVRGPGTTLAKRLRAAEARAGEPQARTQCDARQLFRAVRHAGPEEVLRARGIQGPGSARPDHPLRPGHRRHHGPDRGGDVEHVCAVSRQRDRRAAGAARPRPRSSTAPASSSAPPATF